MRADQITQFARHIVLPDVGGLGQDALLAARARVDGSPAGAIAGRFLVASGVTLAADADLVAIPPAPAWWPGDAVALAWWRGSLAATTFLATTIARARAAHPLEPAQLAAIYAHARAEHPFECCGYVTDVVVPCTNAQRDVAVVADRTAETAFAIDGAELFALVRSLDTANPARIVYHSHGNGRAYFSTLDRETARAGRYPVQHLVVGVTAAGVVECAQFGWDAEADDFVELRRWTP